MIVHNEIKIVLTKNKKMCEDFQKKKKEKISNSSKKQMILVQISLIFLLFKTTD